jgi:hypothetical protein
MMDNTNQYDMCFECARGIPLTGEIPGMLGNTNLIEQRQALSIQSNSDFYIQIKQQHIDCKYAARFKVSNILASSSIGVVGSNPTRGMDVSLRFSLFVLSCLSSGLVMGWSPVQGVLPTVYQIYNFKINSELDRPKSLIRYGRRGRRRRSRLEPSETHWKETWWNRCFAPTLFAKAPKIHFSWEWGSIFQVPDSFCFAKRKPKLECLLPTEVPGFLA